MEVLEKKRPVVTHALALVRMGHGHAIACSVESILGLGIATMVISRRCKK